MRNNLAELRDVSINVESLRTAWAEQVSFAGNYAWESRNYVDLNFFTVYYQQLLLHISDVIEEEPKNYVIQVADSQLYNEKWYLNTTHKDEDRKTCITLPVYYNRMEPINFYDNVDNIPNRGIPIQSKPNQVAQYSEEHPTLINVNNYHNVRVIDEMQPRIFIQMSYDKHFNEFLHKDINIDIL